MGNPQPIAVLFAKKFFTAAPDIKKRIKLKMTKARLGARMARKAKKTKRVNPASKRVAALNKASR